MEQGVLLDWTSVHLQLMHNAGLCHKTMCKSIPLPVDVQSIDAESA